MKFSHDYYKLRRRIFPTVRSINYTRDHNLKIGDSDEIIVKGIDNGSAILIAEDTERINYMGLIFLKYDSQCNDVQINTEQEYVDLLNSFIRFNSNKLTTVKSILWWKWNE